MKDLDIKNFDEFMEINEAQSPEEKKRKRKERRAKKKAAEKAKGKGNSDDIEDIEAMEAKPSKSMAQAVEKWRAEQVKFQDLQKEFVMAKGNEGKRESLKKKLIAQHKIAKKAEAEFERMVAAEEDSFAEEMFFESFDIMKVIEDSISESTVNDMEMLLSGPIFERFLSNASKIIEKLEGAGFDRDDIMEFLSIKIDWKESN